MSDIEESVARVVREEISLDLTPQLDDGSPLLSSGVSSGNSAPPPTPAGKKGGKGQEKAAVVMQCPFCPKTYVTKKYFENHVFVHKMTDLNRLKPSLQDVLPLISDFLLKIFEGILQEPNLPQEKKKVVSEILKNVDSSHWRELTDFMSDLILKPLVERTKVLPPNQYEEFLSKLLKFLNDEQINQKLRSIIALLCNNGESIFIGMISFHISLKLGERVQCFLIEQMRKPFAASSSGTEVTISEKEEGQLKIHIKNIIQQYFIKSSSLDGTVWKARSLCIRKRFALDGDGDETVSAKDLLNNASWNVEVFVSENAFLFFRGIEILMQTSFKESGKFELEALIEKLICQENVSLLNAWHSLVSGYLGEIDSLKFMKEMINIYFSLSLSLEERRLQRVEEERAKLAKFRLRAHLQTN